MATTAQAVVDEILSHCPTLPPTTRDFFAAGDPRAAVQRIAVTFQATRAVLNAAVAAGSNFVITHEPTFYLDGDLSELDADPIVQSKKRFLAEKQLIVWRCHDSIHQMTPDGIVTGMVEALGWTGCATAESKFHFDLPPTTLGVLAKQACRRLKIDSVRVVGDAAMPVRRAALSVGAPGFGRHRQLLAHPQTDVLFSGEGREWETCEYVRDSAATGRPQGMIVLGHANSEEAGMAYFARWLKGKFPQMDVQFIAAGDPFRSISA
jgi:putative NIF3 family GTP cyclohydrolase 1 type 2